MCSSVLRPSSLLKAVSEVLQGRSYVTLKQRSDDWAIPSVVSGLWAKTVKSSTVEVGQRSIPRARFAIPARVIASWRRI